MIYLHRPSHKSRYTEALPNMGLIVVENNSKGKHYNSHDIDISIGDAF
jgi:hypothetical protein